MRKIQLLAEVGWRSPVEFIDRLRAVIEVRAGLVSGGKSGIEAINWEIVVGRLFEILGFDVNASQSEQALHEIEAWVLRGIEQLRNKGPWMLAHNASLGFGRLAYALCRGMRPKIVLETGVAYGVSSAYILKALSVNSDGVLHSIDLPPLAEDQERFVGALIPDDLKDRWCYRRGTSRRVMPGLLAELGQIDLFLHDSLHTYWNMRFELETVWPRLKPGGVLLADDVNENRFFAEFVKRRDISFCAVAEQEDKESWLGVVVKTDAHVAHS